MWPVAACSTQGDQRWAGRGLRAENQINLKGRNESYIEAVCMMKSGHWETQWVNVGWEMTCEGLRPLLEMLCLWEAQWRTVKPEKHCGAQWPLMCDQHLLLAELLLQTFPHLQWPKDFCFAASAYQGVLVQGNALTLFLAYTVKFHFVSVTSSSPSSFYWAFAEAIQFYRIITSAAQQSQIRQIPRKEIMEISVKIRNQS